MTDLVGNPEDRFSRVAAQLMMGSKYSLFHQYFKINKTHTGRLPTHFSCEISFLLKQRKVFDSSNSSKPMAATERRCLLRIRVHGRKNIKLGPDTITAGPPSTLRRQCSQFFKYSKPIQKCIIFAASYKTWDQAVQMKKPQIN